MLIMRGWGSPEEIREYLKAFRLIQAIVEVHGYSVKLHKSYTTQGDLEIAVFTEHNTKMRGYLKYITFYKHQFSFAGLMYRFHEVVNHGQVCNICQYYHWCEHCQSDEEKT